MIGRSLVRIPVLPQCSLGDSILGQDVNTQLPMVTNTAMVYGLSISENKRNMRMYINRVLCKYINNNKVDDFYSIDDI